MVRDKTVRKRSQVQTKGMPIYSTPVFKDAKAASKKLGKGFYVRPRYFGGFSVFRRRD